MYAQGVRCQANTAHIRQSRPDSGLGFQVKVLRSCEVVHASLGCGTQEATADLSARSYLLPSTLGTCKTVNARLWLRLEPFFKGKSLKTRVVLPRSGAVSRLLVGAWADLTEYIHYLDLKSPPPHKIVDSLFNITNKKYRVDRFVGVLTF